MKPSRSPSRRCALFAAHCHLGLGSLFRRMDRSGKAREHLATAAAMYRAMSVGFWPEKADAELLQLT